MKSFPGILVISALLVSAVLGCSSGSSQSTAASSQRSPEQNLAIIDRGGTIPEGAEKPYAVLLDAAEPKCTEGRRSIADLTAKVVEVTTKEGIKTNNLDVLTGATKVLAEYEQPQKCEEVFTALALIMVGGKK